MTSELERLQAMYREMSDEHLQDLADEPEDLTGDARMALAEELRRRGWTAAEPAREPEAVVEPELASGFGAAIPGVVPAGGNAVEQALEPGGEIRKGMLRLISFFDGHELSRGCATLEEAGVDFAIEEVAGDALSGLAPHFELWVEPGAQELSQRLLREKMGLFPLAEVDGETGDGGAGADELVVAEFDSAAEAESVRALLVEAGFAATVQNAWNVGSLSAVVVPADEQERALDMLANRMMLD